MLKETIEKIYTYIYNIIMFICKLLLIADIGITSYAILGRYFGKYIPFISDPAWSEEIVLTCMIYMALISAALAIRRRAHIRMTALDRYLPQKVVQVLDVFGDIVILIFALIMLVEGWQYATLIGIRGTYTSLTWLSKFWLYAPVPFAGLSIALFELEIIYQDIMTLLGKEVKKNGN